MGTKLHELKGKPGSNRARKRIGRGLGSGNGQQAGKGVKGQKARTGHHGARIGFEGGQMPMQRRLPKRGFQNLFRTEYFPVNLSHIATRFDGGEVTVDTLKAAGMVPRTAERVKILGEGEISKKYVVHAHAFSAKAKEKLEQAGGAAELIPTTITKPAGAQPE